METGRAHTEAEVEAAKRGIAHWQAEKDRTLVQIESGLHPEHDDNCRAYVVECSDYIKALMKRVGLAR
jgi:hypothetical protein